MGPEFREDFYSSQRKTLDIAGLSEDQRGHGSIFIGGSSAEFVEPGDDFEYSEIKTLIYKWGDPGAVEVFGKLAETFELDDDKGIFFPFVPVATIGDKIWLQALQSANFQPENMYQNPDDYVVLPYDSETAAEMLDEALSSDERRQILGKVADRFVLFEMATDLSETDLFELESNAENPKIPNRDINLSAEKISCEEALIAVETIIDQWDFEGQFDDQNGRFALNIGYWMVEIFGHNFNDGRFFTSKYTEDIKGEDLPPSISNLITFVWRDEIHYRADNSVEIRSVPMYIENDPIIPRWEEISELETFQKQLKFIKNNADVREGIIPTKVDVMPQISVAYHSGWHEKWGLEFVANHLGVDVLSFGEPGQTFNPMQYVLEKRDDVPELARTLCELAVVGAKHCSRYSDAGGRKFIPAGDVEKLVDRIYRHKDIEPEAAIPLDMHKFRPKPENAVKNLLINTLIREELDDVGEK